MRVIPTYHSLYPPVGDDAAKRTSGKSWKLLLFLGFLPDDVNSAAIGDLIVPQVLAWLQNPPSIDQVCSREEETQIPSGCPHSSIHLPGSCLLQVEKCRCRASPVLTSCEMVM